MRARIAVLLLIGVLGGPLPAGADDDPEKHLLLDPRFGDYMRDYLRDRTGRDNAESCDTFNRSPMREQIEWFDRGCRCLTREDLARLTPERENWAILCLNVALQTCRGSEKIGFLKARCYKESLVRVPDNPPP
ncbi:MAG: hypothetical protein HZC25_12440 [Rhodospirillales bacterium]|nr:hypothetical protein [Rhodospirillales bacterium]